MNSQIILDAMRDYLRSPRLFLLPIAICVSLALIAKRWVSEDVAVLIGSILALTLTVGYLVARRVGLKSTVRFLGSVVDFGLWMLFFGLMAMTTQAQSLGLVATEPIGVRMPEEIPEPGNDKPYLLVIGGLAPCYECPNRTLVFCHTPDCNVPLKAVQRVERFDTKEAAVRRLAELKPHSFALYKVDRVPVKVSKKTVTVQPPPEHKETISYEVQK